MSAVDSVPTEELERSAAELDALRAALFRLHRRRHDGRCSECATWTGNRLRRADWPCPTLKAMGVTDAQ